MSRVAVSAEVLALGNPVQKAREAEDLHNRVEEFLRKGGQVERYQEEFMRQRLNRPFDPQHMSSRDKGRATQKRSRKAQSPT